MDIYLESLTELVTLLKSLGFKVRHTDLRKADLWRSYYGSYSDESGKRVVSFHIGLCGAWEFSGSYINAPMCGDGWSIKLSRLPSTREDFERILYESAPMWANPNPVYKTWKE